MDVESLICYNTPIEMYNINNIDIYVKREDLAGIPPFPPSAKVRGAYNLIRNLSDQGVESFGAYNTRVSIQSLTYASICYFLKKKLIIGFPYIKKEVPLSVQKSETLGSYLYPISNPRMSIGIAHLKKYLKEQNSYYLPLGVNCNEGVSAIKKEADTVPDDLFKGTVVLSVGSGVTLAGILQSI